MLTCVLVVDVSMFHWQFPCFYDCVCVGVSVTVCMRSCVSVIGCGQPKMPSGAYLTRNGDQAFIGCSGHRRSWNLLCRNNEWVGEIGECGHQNQGTYQCLLGGLKKCIGWGNKKGWRDHLLCLEVIRTVQQSRISTGLLQMLSWASSDIGSLNMCVRRRCLLVDCGEHKAPNISGLMQCMSLGSLDSRMCSSSKFSLATLCCSGGYQRLCSQIFVSIYLRCCRVDFAHSVEVLDRVALGLVFLLLFHCVNNLNYTITVAAPLRPLENSSMMSTPTVRTCIQSVVR